MAEVLVAVSSIVSVTQLFVYIVQTTRSVVKFCDTVHDTPSQIHRIKESLRTLKEVVEGVHSCQRLVNDDSILPPDLRQALFEAVKRTNEAIDRMQNRPELSTAPSKESLQWRVRWALVGKDKIEKDLRELEHCEELLDRVIQLINLRGSLLASVYAKQSTELIQRLDANLSIFFPAQQTVNVTTFHGSMQKVGRGQAPSPGLIRWRQAVMDTDNWLRRLGFYGSFTSIVRVATEDEVRIHIGFRIPQWVSTKSIDICLEFSRLSAQAYGIRILGGEIELQNRVSDDSLFMTACRKGDTKLIKQLLDEKTASVRYRTESTGSTPLLLAIEGNHFQAVKCLLDHGADPNIGDDNETRLPLFATLGLNSPRGNKWVRQLPPKWDSWLEAFQLLIEKGASVHEINNNRSLIHLNICHGSPGVNVDYPEPSALKFFQILEDQCFTDFNLPGPDLWTPVLTAIRRESGSVEALRYLSKLGVDLSRIATTGHTSLHWAAEMAYDIDCLEFLCSRTAYENVNRQDIWGWTPLHYAVSSGRYGYSHVAIEKLKCLLRYGADPSIKAGKHPMFFVRIPLTEEFTPLELGLQTNSDLSVLFEGEIQRAMSKDEATKDEETFFDTVESRL